MARTGWATSSSSSADAEPRPGARRRSPGRGVDVEAVVDRGGGRCPGRRTRAAVSSVDGDVAPRRVVGRELGHVGEPRRAATAGRGGAGSPVARAGPRPRPGRPVGSAGSCTGSRPPPGRRRPAPRRPSQRPGRPWRASARLDGEAGHGAVDRALAGHGDHVEADDRQRAGPGAATIDTPSVRPRRNETRAQVGMVGGGCSAMSGADATGRAADALPATPSCGPRAWPCSTPLARRRASASPTPRPTRGSGCGTRASTPCAGPPRRARPGGDRAGQRCSPTRPPTASSPT